LRLFDRRAQRAVLVDAASRRAWADHDRDGRFEDGESLTGEALEEALRAAAQIERLFMAPIPGATTLDGTFEVWGVASPSEMQALTRGGSIEAQRSKLAQHLDFFDVDRDGKISVSETFRGFRSVGVGLLASFVKALAVAVLFGKLRDGFAVDIDAIGATRYPSPTGIYDRNGHLDEAKLAEFLAEFARRGGALSNDELMTHLEKKGIGTVSKRQFQSLVSVCTVINGTQTVTAQQFRALFDGTLLWQAASLTDHRGQRGL
jgi:peroxygenase